MSSNRKNNANLAAPNSSEAYADPNLYEEYPNANAPAANLSYGYAANMNGAGRKRRRASRKASRKTQHKHRKATRKASRKHRKASRKASRKSRKASRK